MGKAFENVKVGDQLEMPYGKSYWARTEQGTLNTVDPKSVAEVWIVTARWYDPFDEKDYVCIERMKKDGEPLRHTKRKHTITGLAQQGYYFASKDWQAHTRAVEAGKNNGNIVSLHAARTKKPKIDPTTL